MTKVYFPNLNGIRFIAAFLVIIHHIEQIKRVFGLENNWSNPVVEIIGKLGVVLFFVLSGFLITYLLLVEKSKTGTIAVKEFYMRRILRIWPLYYLIVGLSFLVFSQLPLLAMPEWSGLVLSDLPVKLTLFILFLPNLAILLFAPVPYASQTWSVGVEEQFYLIWPVLIKSVKNKQVLLYSIIFICLFMKLAGFSLIQQFLFWNNSLEIARSFVADFSIDCMAIGGLFALYLFNKAKIIGLLFSKPVQIANILVLCVLIGKGYHVPYIHYEFYGVLFGILILNLAANENSVLRLENKAFHYLGKISYGLYMYHPLAIVIAIKLLSLAGITAPAFQYLTSVLLTILIAGLSYEYFEAYFIRKKAKHSKILSGEEATQQPELAQARHGVIN
jgi:peptidoglycan/LPS O-acetylase OafA/YrhL